MLVQSFGMITVPFPSGTMAQAPTAAGLVGALVGGVVGGVVGALVGVSVAGATDGNHVPATQLTRVTPG